jgi:hypothetical protein|tara:strand:+ start:714 stop:1442 length:729 start_codon:yes stop_codon:yes gene_type:complete
MPIDPVSAAIGIGGSVLSGILGGSAAKRAKRRAQAEARRLKGKLEFLENNRQAIINPYEGISDLSGMVTDRSAQMTNAYNNLSVATQAAEMKIEQSDIALANTLDTLMQTGSGAGGATALAQAALQSKKEVAASIESQEAANEKLRAQGEEALEQRQMAEKARIEGIQLQQAEKVQEADVAGKQFVFSQKENREQQKIDRTAAELDNARMMAAQAQADQTSAFTGMLGGITNSLASAYTAPE